MVIIELSGGLGNQMFQFALYEKFKSLGKKAVLDTSFFRSDQKLRRLELGLFGLAYKEITDEEAAVIRGFGYHDSVWDRIRYKLMPSKYIVYRDKIDAFQPDIFQMDNVYLSGYWQNEKYFDDIKYTIQKCFTFPEVCGDENRKILENIRKTNSVGIHVRRGDYLSGRNKSVYGGICTERYYQNARSFLEERIEMPVYYLFTDDPEWARINLYTTETVIVENNKEKNAWIDMYLMSQCKHNIVANSSFSWWGAWLNRNMGKVVIAPSRWFGNHTTTDIICKDWNRVSI